MSKWFYYDMSGIRRGPIESRKLRELVAQGIVVPETQVETDTGKKALAKQISGLFLNSNTENINQNKKASGQYQVGTVPRNYAQGNIAPYGLDVDPFDRSISVYCTNCGASIMPSAPACMNCGAAPVGHRKFCHICGTSLNPEQIICIQCKSPIGQQQSYNKDTFAYTPYVNVAPTIKRTDTGDENEKPVRNWKKTFFYLSIPLIMIVISIVLFSFLRNSNSPNNTDNNATPLVEVEWRNNANWQKIKEQKEPCRLTFFSKASDAELSLLSSLPSAIYYDSWY